MTAWRDERNAAAKARLLKAVPALYPSEVLAHALGSPLVPPLPSLAVTSYWRHHVVEADDAARRLAALSSAPEGWAWRLGSREDGLASSFRSPPAPFRETAHHRGAGSCCICGQAVYRFGWHVDLWGDGANRRAAWHACCVAAWKLWTAPADHARVLRRQQNHKCSTTGRRLLKSAEVDHAVPLHRVWRDHRDAAWPALLDFWGVPNLQVINRVAHSAKSATEATDRARLRDRHRGAEEVGPGVVVEMA